MLEIRGALPRRSWCYEQLEQRIVRAKRTRARSHYAVIAGANTTSVDLYTVRAVDY
jgi:hypothetical protein